MSGDPEMRATIALLARALLPDFGQEITEQKLRALLEEEIHLAEEERVLLASMDPLAFRKHGGETVGRIIPFPSAEDDLDVAVGFNRSSETNDPDDASDQVREMRGRIIKRLREDKSGPQGSPQDSR